MANPYINVYMNNPTEGATDGTAVSTDGAFTAPISFALDASQDEEQIIPLAIRTERGYKTVGDVTISDQNDTNDRLKLCWTQDGTFADSISTANSISSVNTIFYAKATSASSENPQTDRSASFKVNATIATV